MQGVLDENFLQVQQLQDESSPNFVSEVFNVYFHHAEKLLTHLRTLLADGEFTDYKKIGICLNLFMGSSSSIGAKRLRNVCIAFRAASHQNNRPRCLKALEVLEYEYCYLKNKLYELFQFHNSILIYVTHQHEWKEARIFEDFQHSQQDSRSSDFQEFSIEGNKTLAENLRKHAEGKENAMHKLSTAIGQSSPHTLYTPAPVPHNFYRS
ncbi:histidine-containing phosphotransfer protein 6 [Sesamum alatum]|uniref:Histidine-containing phosphotransfer protein n=1 Tax=Sesamum alatum TaxID=300844 RepID=A0AAE2C9G9_9LAMI|nr:histidine-containing phosphotransfer protein 6 [Sesamum alatum]